MFSKAYYKELETITSAASDVLTVGYLRACEAFGEPWPISGDATAIMNGAAK